MRFAHFSHVWTKPGMRPADRYGQLWREIALGDAVGFDYGFTVEHHYRDYESWMCAPLAYATSAAHLTRRLRVGPMGYIVPASDPLRLVEEASLVDNMLAGRFEMGLVSGISPDYLAHARIDFSRRREYTNEAVRFIRRAFAAGTGPFDFHGALYDYRDVTLSVASPQPGGPPVWLQSRDPDTLAMLAGEGIDTGYTFLFDRATAAQRYRPYIGAWAANGHRRPPRIGYWALVYVAETDEAALAQARPHVEHCFTRVFGVRYEDGAPRPFLVEQRRRRGELGGVEIAENVADIRYLRDRALMFVGSPDTVAAQLQAASAEGLFNVLFGEFNFGALPEEDVMRSIRLFGEAVIPRLRDWDPVADAHAAAVAQAAG